MKKKLLLMTLIMTGALASMILAGCGEPEIKDATEAAGELAEAAGNVKPEIEAIVTEAVEAASKVDEKDVAAAVDVAEAVADEVTDALKDADAIVEDVAETDASTDAEAALEEAMKDVKDINPTKKMYAMKDCNVRKGPSTDFDVVGHLKFNEEIEVVGQHKGGWYEFKQGENVVFVSDQMVGDTQIDMAAAQAALEALAAQAAQAQGQAKQPQVAQNQAPAAASTVPVVTQAPVKVTAPAGVLFIGDSRCVQMRDALMGGGCSWICRNGARYEWFAETAIPQADTMVGKGTKVIICMGVNDPGDAGKYAALANLKAAEWAARGAKTYYVSVNPVWENPYTSEEQVMAFNSSIVGQLMGIKWIDTHTYLQGAGYKLVDGLHYDGETYFKIFSAIMSSL